MATQANLAAIMVLTIMSLPAIIVLSIAHIKNKRK